jgi:superfamily II DNA or RNA helicase
LEAAGTDRKIYLIHGKTEADAREYIRRVIDRESNAILVASFGTTSTGINIVNLDNIIFASPTKSIIRLLQSIGRGLRVSAKRKHSKYMILLMIFAGSHTRITSFDILKNV